MFDSFPVSVEFSRAKGYKQVFGNCCLLASARLCYEFSGRHFILVQNKAHILNAWMHFIRLNCIFWGFGGFVLTLWQKVTHFFPQFQFRYSGEKFQFQLQLRIRIRIRKSLQILIRIRIRISLLKADFISNLGPTKLVGSRSKCLLKFARCDIKHKYFCSNSRHWISASSQIEFCPHDFASATRISASLESQIQRKI